MDQCALCRRTIPTTRHHLIPENRAESPVVHLCSPCHRQVHALFTNEELKAEFDSIETLREADRLQSFLDWISTTTKTHIQVRDSDHVREQRRY